MIKIGDKVRFNGFEGNQDYLIGKVVEIHKKHHWFAVEYCLGEDNTKLRTSFHFADIDVNVFKGEKHEQTVFNA